MGERNVKGPVLMRSVGAKKPGLSGPVYLDGPGWFVPCGGQPAPEPGGGPDTIPGLVGWLDATDFSRMYQDAGKLQPVTAIGQDCLTIEDRAGAYDWVASNAFTVADRGGGNPCVYAGTTGNRRFSAALATPYPGSVYCLVRFVNAGALNRDGLFGPSADSALFVRDTGIEGFALGGGVTSTEWAANAQEETIGVTMDANAGQAPWTRLTRDNGGSYFDLPSQPTLTPDNFFQILHNNRGLGVNVVHFCIYDRVLTDAEFAQLGAWAATV